MSTNEKIARRLKKAREQRGISQKTLAELCGWVQSRVGNYESGARRISVDDAVILSRELYLTPAELMFGELPPNSPLITEKEQELLRLFNQLPETEQDRMIGVFNIRLEEIDDYVDKYLRGRCRNTK